jgi:UPF0755 protein
LPAPLLLFGAGLWWLHEPIALRLAPGSQVVDLEIEPGTPASGVAEVIVASGADVPACSCMPGSVSPARPG